MGKSVFEAGDERGLRICCQRTIFTVEKNRVPADGERAHDELVVPVGKMVGSGEDPP